MTSRRGKLSRLAFWGFSIWGAGLIVLGLVTSVLSFIQGDALKGALLLLFNVAGGSLTILWTRFLWESDARSAHPRSDWRDWLSDYLVIIGFGSALALELYIYGTSEPWVIAPIAVILLPFVFLQYLNLTRLTGDPSLWRFLLAFLGRVRFSVPLIAGAAAGLAIGEPSSPPSILFFEAAAQLIALLALVLAVEARAYALGSSENPGRLVLVLYTFAAMGVGEFFCLRVLAFQKVGEHDLALVGGVFVTTFVSILVQALLGPVKVERLTDGPSGSSESP